MCVYELLLITKPSATKWIYTVKIVLHKATRQTLLLIGIGSVIYMSSDSQTICIIDLCWCQEAKWGPPIPQRLGHILSDAVPGVLLFILVRLH